MRDATEQDAGRLTDDLGVSLPMGLAQRGVMPVETCDDDESMRDEEASTCSSCCSCFTCEDIGSAALKLDALDALAERGVLELIVEEKGSSLADVQERALLGLCKKPRAELRAMWLWLLSMSTSIEKLRAPAS